MSLAKACLHGGPNDGEVMAIQIGEKGVPYRISLPRHPNPADYVDSEPDGDLAEYVADYDLANWCTHCGVADYSYRGEHEKALGI